MIDLYREPHTSCRAGMAAEAPPVVTGLLGAAIALIPLSRGERLTARWSPSTSLRRQGGGCSWRVSIRRMPALTAAVVDLENAAQREDRVDTTGFKSARDKPASMHGLGRGGVGAHIGGGNLRYLRRRIFW